MLKYLIRSSHYRWHCARGELNAAERQGAEEDDEGGVLEHGREGEEGRMEEDAGTEDDDEQQDKDWEVEGVETDEDYCQDDEEDEILSS